jgi:hypothetical protein
LTVNAVVTVRRFRDIDAPVLWALNALPNVGETADPGAPIPLPPAVAPPASFPDLADVKASFLARGLATLGADRASVGGVT